MDTKQAMGQILNVEDAQRTPQEPHNVLISGSNGQSTKGQKEKVKAGQKETLEANGPCVHCTPGKGAGKLEALTPQAQRDGTLQFGTNGRPCSTQKFFGADEQGHNNMERR